MLYIVGLGPGSEEYLTYKAVKVLESSQLIIGFKRAIQDLHFINTQKISVKGLQEIIEIINLKKDHRDISVIASGDPCFYGIVNFIKSNYKGDFTVIPGISSFQYMMAKLNKPWQKNYLGSLHGREEELVKLVRENKSSIWLTDKENSAKAICRRLCESNLSPMVYVGENLSYQDEKITVGTASELKDIDFCELSVVVIENEIL